MPRELKESEKLAAQNLKNLFKFHSYLLDYLLALRDIRLCVVTGQALTRTADRKALVIQQAPDLSNDQDVLALIIATIAASLYRFELRELLFPIPEYVRLNSTKIADFTYREIALTRYWRKFVVIPRFQHMLPLGPLVFVLVGRSPRAER